MDLGAPLRRTVGGQHAPRCDTRVPSQYGTLRGGHATTLSATGIVRLGWGDVNGPAALPRVEAPCRVGQPASPPATVSSRSLARPAVTRMVCLQAAPIGGVGAAPGVGDFVLGDAGIIQGVGAGGGLFGVREAVVVVIAIARVAYEVAVEILLGGVGAFRAVVIG